LDGELALRKVATYTQNNTNRINIHALSEIQTHDASI
jgi:hypothetical protein